MKITTKIEKPTTMKEGIKTLEVGRQLGEQDPVECLKPL
jgi:hypothetical protein